MPFLSRRRLVPAVVFLSVLLVTAGCGGKKEEAAPEPTIPATTTTTLPPIAPLTGLAVADAALVNRPVLAVKIDNSQAGRPQVGLDAADVVYEEEVEGITRLLALFHSADADPLGPVRSYRSTDIDILVPLGPMLANSGSNNNFRRLLANTAAIVDVGTDKLNEQNEFYSRLPGYKAPYNLFAHPGPIRERSTGDLKPPPPFSPFLGTGEAFAGAAAAPAVHVDLKLKSTSVAYDFDAATNTWKRTMNGTPHTVEGGAQIAPTNVIIQLIPYQNTGERDRAGAPVPEGKVVGSGEVLIFSGGTIVKGTWSKPSASAVTTFADSAGAPIRLQPGRTWVEMPAVGTRINVS